MTQTSSETPWWVVNDDTLVTARRIVEDGEAKPPAETMTLGEFIKRNQITGEAEDELRSDLIGHSLALVSGLGLIYNVRLVEDGTGAAADQPDPPSARDELPYAAVSINGRAMEWEVPLWDAINRLPSADLTEREALVVLVSDAVQIAMRLAREPLLTEINSLNGPSCPHDGHRASEHTLLCGGAITIIAQSVCDRCEDDDHAGHGGIRCGGLTHERKECECIGVHPEWRDGVGWLRERGPAEPWRPASRSGPDKRMEPEKLSGLLKSCNRHQDCAAATDAFKLRTGGQLPGFGFHCHDEACEDCFGS